MYLDRHFSDSTAPSNTTYQPCVKRPLLKKLRIRRKEYQPTLSTQGSLLSPSRFEMGLKSIFYWEISCELEDNYTVPLHHYTTVRYKNGWPHTTANWYPNVLVPCLLLQRCRKCTSIVAWPLGATFMIWSWSPHVWQRKVGSDSRVNI